MNNPFDLNTFLPYRFSVIASAMSKNFAALYEAEFAITNPEWRVIAHLANNRRISVREIVEMVDLDKVRVSRAVTALTSRGIINKRTSKQDRRLVELTLTRKGRSLYKQMVPRAKHYQCDVLKALTPEDRKTLMRLLKQLDQHLKTDRNTA